MPIYEYKCKYCGFSIEIMQKISDKAPICKNILNSGSAEQMCGGKCEKLISKGSFSLKGGGWYVDGYMKPSKSDKEA